MSAAVHRRGLAPLELVLCLPILLFVMALMVTFGWAVCWKVKGSTNARHGVWRTRWPRSGNLDGNPNTWLPPASMAIGAGKPLAQLDDPAIRHAVVRGPLPNNFGVDSNLLDPSRGERVGSAQKTLTMPTLPKLGKYPLAVSHSLMDDGWQYQRMGMPWHVYRRTLILYTLPKAGPSLAAAFAEAVHAIVSAPFRQQLDPLDRDEELKKFYGFYPSFYPGLHEFCGLMDSDSSEISSRVEQFIQHIQGQCVNDGNQVQIADWGVPGSLTGTFLNMYETLLAQLEAWERQPLPPRPPPTKLANSELKQRIRQLEEFRKFVEQRIKEECENPSQRP